MKKDEKVSTLSQTWGISLLTVTCFKLNYRDIKIINNKNRVIYVTNIVTRL
jgi:hypothetical protein